MKKEFYLGLSVFIMLSLLFFWWFGPREEILVKKCSEEIFNGEWTITGGEAANQLEKVRVLKEMCLLDKGIIQ